DERVRGFEQPNTSAACVASSRGFRPGNRPPWPRDGEARSAQGGDWLKVVFGILVAIDASLVGWLAQNYTTASRLLVLAGGAGTAVVTVAVVLIHRLAYDRIRELEDA